MIKFFTKFIFLSDLIVASPEVRTFLRNFLFIFNFFKNSTTFVVGRGAFDKKNNFFYLFLQVFPPHVLRKHLV